MKKYRNVLFIIFVVLLFICPVFAEEPDLKVELVEFKDCNGISPLLDVIQLALDYVRIVGISLAVIFQIGDYLKAVFSSKEDDVIKANGHFATRIISVGLLFLVPSLVIFAIQLFNVQGASDVGTCGIY